MRTVAATVWVILLMGCGAMGGSGSGEVEQRPFATEAGGATSDARPSDAARSEGSPLGGPTSALDEGLDEFDRVVAELDRAVTSMELAFEQGDET